MLHATWKLWAPQEAYPEVPLSALFVNTHPWADWCGLGLTLGAIGIAAAGLAARSSWRWPLLGFAVGVGWLVLSDQHRAQPWAWQFALTALVLWGVPPHRAIVCLRVLTLGIYFHSATSKLDFSFCNSLGPLFLQTLTERLGVASNEWPIAVRRTTSLLFPLGELLATAGLLIPRCRRAGLAAALSMHFLMLVILGPWGLGHQRGVLIWNVFFMVQDVVLFWPDRAPCCAALNPTRVFAIDQSRRHPVIAAAVQWLIGAAVVLPFLEPWGVIDVWPAWGLYSSRGERATILLHESARDRMPLEIRRFLDDSAVSDSWLRLRYDRWSLEAVAAPTYPQNRFALGVALAIGERYRLEPFQIRIQLESAANRWTGRRSARTLTGTTEILAEAKRHWLNAIPRDFAGNSKP